ncbi:MAG: helix-turn-helix transcriptional regulator [Subdoligranulum sp.]|nr:helix-turn-helix transcriptional regulator [Subdoligranulum sp.]
MIDPRIGKRIIGKRIKESRERLGLTQEQFAEKSGFTANYISALERGKSFPRCESLIILLNNLEVSADAIFRDVVIHTHQYRENQLSDRLDDLPPEVSSRILQLLELLIQQEMQKQDSLTAAFQ